MFTDLISIGSINNYIKTADMQNKWQQKKSNCDFKADGISSMSEWVEKQNRKMDEYCNSASEEPREKDTALTQIITKYSNGGKLTPSEMSYIQRKDPAFYQKVKAAEEEVRQYESQLRRCRTQEEVRKLKMAHAAVSLSRVNEIKNNPNIPQEKKLEYIMQEKRKNDDMEKVSRKFVKSGELASLPTEAEYRKVERETAEARREQLRGKKSEEKQETEVEVKKEPVGKTEDRKDSVKTKKTIRIVKKKARTVKKRSKTLYEAQNSREARKIKRSRAKRAYTAAVSAAAGPDCAAAQLDGKA